jgi:hypothetical protein
MERAELSNGEVIFFATTAELVAGLKLDAGVEIIKASVNAQGVTFSTRVPVTVVKEEIVDVATGVKIDKPTDPVVEPTK